MDKKNKLMRTLGGLIAAGGLMVAGVGFGYGVPAAVNGLESAQALYAAQGVNLSYNAEGELVDRGAAEGAQNIMNLLEGEWDYPVNYKKFDPEDPLVNTRDELMYQFATISYHVMHTEVAVTLAEDQLPLEYRGETYTEPGEYMIAVEKSYAQLDRTHPIESQLRAAWSPQALGLLSSLSAGHANQAAGELALAAGAGVGGLGLLVAAGGAGMYLANKDYKPKKE